MKILIIRHGDPDYEHDSLTEKGLREAEYLSKRMAKENVRDFYVSPLGRAQATAAPTLALLNRTAETLPWLCEFRGKIIEPHSGRSRICWNLMPQYWTNSDDLMDRARWRDDPLIKTGDAGARYDEVIGGLDALLARYGYAREGLLFRCEHNIPDTLALFCHAGVGAVMISGLTGVPPLVLLNASVLPTSSVTTLIGEERRPGEVFFRLFQMGDTSHLFANGEPVSRAGLFPECYDPDKSVY